MDRLSKEIKKESFIYNKEIEFIIIGCLLVSQDCSCIEKLIKSNITLDYFYTPNAQILYSVIEKLYKENIAVDLVTVTDYLNKKDLLEELGGYDFLFNIAESVPSLSHFDSYLSNLKITYSQRRLQEIAIRLKEKALDNNIIDTLSYINNETSKIKNINVKKNDLTFKELVNNSVEKFKNIKAGKPSGEFLVKTGLDSLDNIFTPKALSGGDFIVFAGRPGMGKTTFVLNIALNVAMKKLPVLIFEIEMSKQKLTDCLISIDSNIQLLLLRNGLINDSEMDRYIESANKLSELNISIEQSYLMYEISTIIAEKQREFKQIGLIVIDYLQLLKLDKSTIYNQNIMFEDITATLKRLALEFNVPVIAISHFSRDIEKRMLKRPQLSDLRGSGGIEQNTDIVLSLYRDEYYNKEKSKFKSIAEIGVLKNREGESNLIIPFYFNPKDSLKFFELTNEARISYNHTINNL